MTKPDEMAHYYMSGIYAGFGRKHVDDPKYDTKVVVHGPHGDSSRWQWGTS